MRSGVGPAARLKERVLVAATEEKEELWEWSSLKDPAETPEL